MRENNKVYMEQTHNHARVVKLADDDGGGLQQQQRGGDGCHDGETSGGSPAGRARRRRGRGFGGDDVDADLHAVAAVSREAAEEVARADGGERHDVVAGAEGGDVVGAGAGVVARLDHLHHVVQLRRVRERCQDTGPLYNLY